MLRPSVRAGFERDDDRSSRVQARGFHVDTTAEAAGSSSVGGNEHASRATASSKQKRAECALAVRFGGG
jgi:hypothetical protein